MEKDILVTHFHQIDLTITLKYEFAPMFSFGIFHICKPFNNMIITNLVKIKSSVFSSCIKIAFLSFENRVMSLISWRKCVYL